MGWRVAEARTTGSTFAREQTCPRETPESTEA